MSGYTLLPCVGYFKGCRVKIDRNSDNTIIFLIHPWYKIHHSVTIINLIITFLLTDSFSNWHLPTSLKFQQFSINFLLSPVMLYPIFELYTTPHWSESFIYAGNAVICHHKISHIFAMEIPLLGTEKHDLKWWLPMKCFLPTTESSGTATISHQLSPCSGVTAELIISGGRRVHQIHHYRSSTR